jgi:hypothetical protein
LSIRAKGPKVGRLPSVFRQIASGAGQMG